jgi:hypothetical protein
MPESMFGVILEIVKENSQLTPIATAIAAVRTWFGATSPATLMKDQQVTSDSRECAYTQGTGPQLR